MTKKISIIVIVLILITIFFLVFDIGRREGELSKPEDTLPTNIINDNSTSTIVINSDSPVISNIIENQVLSSPIKIEGKARGNWFFEGSFPIDLIDGRDNLIGNAIAKADGEWMTTDYVNFTATLEYTKSTSTDSALLIFSKDNPSDNADLDESIYIPVKLK